MSNPDARRLERGTTTFAGRDNSSFSDCSSSSCAAARSEQSSPQGYIGAKETLRKREGGGSKHFVLMRDCGSGREGGEDAVGRRRGEGRGGGVRFDT